MKRFRFIGGVLLAALWIAPLRAQQPTGTVGGRVVDDASKQPLSGVTVTIGSRGAQTLGDGHFLITGVAAGTDTIRARMLGYAPGAQAVTVVAGQTVVVADFSLVQQAIGLSEIVVTGYGTQRAGDITGAVKQLTLGDFNPGAITNPVGLIQDKVAGVQVVENSNAPGAGFSIRVRGSTSVNAGNDPLYVIDGMPVGNGSGGGLAAGSDPLNFLNPADIESITVLKDASAAAIYGTNAANGVVLITTKSASAAGGRRGQQVEYSTTASAQSVTKVADVLTPTQFRAAVTQFAPGRVSLLGSANTNWFDLITHTGYGTEQNLSLTNAGEGLFYRLSLGYLKQNGIIRNSSTERLSLGLNYDQRLFNNRLDIKANLKGSRTNDVFLYQSAEGSVLGNAASMAPTQPVLDPTNVTGYWDWQTSGASSSNPVAELNRTTDHGTTWRSVGNLQADYQLPWIEGLRANLNLGYDVAQADRSRFYPNNLAEELRQTHGFLSLANNSQVNTVLEGYLNYVAPLNLVPGRIDVTGGYSYAQSHGVFPYFQEIGLNSNLLGINGVPTATTVQNSTNVVDNKLISFFGRFNYNLSDRYMVAASVRRDGSSRFGANNAWGTFPSVSVAWRISQEPFLRFLTPLSDLKLRAGWARTGNQAFADYQQYATVTYSDAQTQYLLGSNGFVTTIRPAAVDPNIKWEETSSYNVGLDFGLLNQRISGSIDWYTKKTKDLIFTVPVAAFTNFSNFLTTNIGASRNQGIEVALNARVLQGRSNGLSWTANFTASHNANTLLSINPSRSVALIQVGGVSGGVGTTIQVLKPGATMNSFYVCQQYYQDGKPVEGKFVSLADTIASACDAQSLRPYHSPEPTLILGHTSNLTYGNFDLSFTLRAYVGNYVYNNVASQGAYQALTSGGSPSNISATVLKTGFVAPQYLSDYFVQDASFLRMDNVTLGYTFRYRGQPLRLYAAVQNAFTITGYSGVDPTAGLGGIDNNIYPRSRTVTGGLSVRF